MGGRLKGHDSVVADPTKRGKEGSAFLEGTNLSEFIRWPDGIRTRVGAHNVPFDACSGFTRIAARRLADPPMVGRCSESFSNSVALLAASVATGMYRQFPGQDFHLQETRPLSRRTFMVAFSPCIQAFRSANSAEQRGWIKHADGVGQDVGHTACIRAVQGTGDSEGWRIGLAPGRLPV